MRCISTGVRMGGQLFDAEDPWAEVRDRNDRAYAIDHFFTKLFKLPKTMQTERGRTEALSRVQTMSDFLNALGKEIGHPFPPPTQRSMGE